MRMGPELGYFEPGKLAQWLEGKRCCCCLVVVMMRRVKNIRGPA